MTVDLDRSDRHQSVSPLSQDANEPSATCEDDRCRSDSSITWYCIDCDNSYCDECWPLQGPHRPNKKSRDGVPHEKTDLSIVKLFREILEPAYSEAEIQTLHEQDVATKWFGVSRSSDGLPVFEDRGRYARLMTTICPANGLSTRFPQLVSFIGTTGGGKSSLIKMLIGHLLRGVDHSNRHLFPSPVPGSLMHENVPTSGDVHLYADPATHQHQLPLLYADCEGFEGGERIPIGARVRQALHPTVTTSSDQDDDDEDSDAHASSYKTSFDVRNIEWAQTQEMQRREFAVTALYPRLLYTFSDCVVFVLRNPRTFQSVVLTKLLNWGNAALEKSINQPALPHCIVALNATDPGINDRFWDAEYATKSLLESVNGALSTIEGVPRFQQLAQYWRSLGKRIDSVEDLIRQYYSSFKVIRIPSKPSYTVIGKQIEKLHHMIKQNAEDSFRMKRAARMLSNAEELNIYLKSGFDHFTRHLDIPFNFMQVSLARNPIPRDFGGHILQLINALAKHLKHHPSIIPKMLMDLTVMLASCIILDCTRFRKGQVDQLYASYEKFFDHAIDEYGTLHCPCSFTAFDHGRKCQLVKARHTAKGHQDERGIIAAGDYQSVFDTGFIPLWKNQLRHNITSMHNEFIHELQNPKRAAITLSMDESSMFMLSHVEHIGALLHSFGPASAIQNHVTCLCCLMEAPEHMLPCGHVLCTSCVRACGQSSRASVTLRWCPLHQTDTRWLQPTIIKFKPVGAGARILSLDEGGIRGVVQLEVLRGIEQALNGYLPIQAFFDLIVGSGTGALIGTALATRDRTVDSCIDMFSAICDHAFNPRLTGIPVLSHVALAVRGGPKFKHKPLYSALKTAFTEDEHLFGPGTTLRNGLRVALTATSATHRQTVLLTNYRCTRGDSTKYTHERPVSTHEQLTIWESVAASLANPLLFRPLTSHNRSYESAETQFLNPSAIAEQERNLIWPDDVEPDLFLSLGTGQNRRMILSKMAQLPSGGRDADTNFSNTLLSPKAGRRTNRKTDVFAAELSWLEFKSHILQPMTPDLRDKRYVRFNPDLKRDPPAHDGKSDLSTLQFDVRAELRTPHRMAALRNVAHRLVASCFYLAPSSNLTVNSPGKSYSGTICCRYDDGDAELSALGRILAERMTMNSFQVHFLIRPESDSNDPAYTIPVTTKVLGKMIEESTFTPIDVFIPTRNPALPTVIALVLMEFDGLEPDGHAISGFPRLLHDRASKSGSSYRRPSNRPSIAKSQRSASIRAPSLEPESISLNGSRFASSSPGSVHTLSSKTAFSTPRTDIPKLSLTDLIMWQQQESGANDKQKTNRFWTYIGNNRITHTTDAYNKLIAAQSSLDTASNDIKDAQSRRSIVSSYRAPQDESTVPHLTKDRSRTSYLTDNRQRHIRDFDSIPNAEALSPSANRASPSPQQMFPVRSSSRQPVISYTVPRAATPGRPPDISPGRTSYDAHNASIRANLIDGVSKYNKGDDPDSIQPVASTTAANIVQSKTVVEQYRPTFFLTHPAYRNRMPNTAPAVPTLPPLATLGPPFRHYFPQTQDHGPRYMPLDANEAGVQTAASRVEAP